MRPASLLGLAAAPIALVATLFAPPGDPTSPSSTLQESSPRTMAREFTRGIRVPGRATSTVAPAAARLSVHVEGTEDSPARALELYAEVARKVDVALTEMGIPEASVQRHGPRIEHVVPSPYGVVEEELTTGFRAVEARTVTVTAGESVGALRAKLLVGELQRVLAGTLDAGARLPGIESQLGQATELPTVVEYVVNDDEYLAAERAAMQRAIDDARARAAHLAQAAGVELGDVLAVDMLQPLPRITTGPHEVGAELLISVLFDLR